MIGRAARTSPILPSDARMTLLHAACPWCAGRDAGSAPASQSVARISPSMIDGLGLHAHVGVAERLDEILDGLVVLGSTQRLHAFQTLVRVVALELLHVVVDAGALGVLLVALADLLAVDLCSRGGRAPMSSKTDARRRQCLVQLVFTPAIGVRNIPVSLPLPDASRRRARESNHDPVRHLVHGVIRRLVALELDDDRQGAALA